MINAKAITQGRSRLIQLDGWALDQHVAAVTYHGAMRSMSISPDITTA